MGMMLVPSVPSLVIDLSGAVLTSEGYNAQDLNDPNCQMTLPSDQNAVKPELGVPALYYARTLDGPGPELQAEDYEALRDTWAAWRERRA